MNTALRLPHQDHEIEAREATMFLDSKRIGDYCVEDYLSGRCHLFALAISQVTGLPLALWLDEEAWFDDLTDPLPALEHAFCLHRDDESAGVDAKGPRDLKDIESDYASASNSPLLITGDQASAVVSEWLQLGLLCNFDVGEHAALIHFIQTHLHALTGPIIESEPEVISPRFRVVD